MEIDALQKLEGFACRWWSFSIVVHWASSDGGLGCSLWCLGVRPVEDLIVIGGAVALGVGGWLVWLWNSMVLRSGG